MPTCEDATMVISPYPMLQRAGHSAEWSKRIHMDPIALSTVSCTLDCVDRLTHDVGQGWLMSSLQLPIFPAPSPGTDRSSTRPAYRASVFRGLQQQRHC